VADRAYQDAILPRHIDVRSISETRLS
jgi:hypothetical protein